MGVRTGALAALFALALLLLVNAKIATSEFFPTTVDSQPNARRSDSPHDLQGAPLAAFLRPVQSRIDSSERAEAYMRFVDRLTSNLTLREILYENPARLPPNLQRRLAYATDKLFDSMLFNYKPGEYLDTPEQAIAQRAQHAASSHSKRADRSQFRAKGGVNNRSSHTATELGYTSTALPMQQQQRQKQPQGFSSQAAKGGYVTGVRVIVSIEFMLAGKTTIYDYIYYLAENQISVACTTCASFLVYVGMYSYSYIEPITAYVIDSPCQSAKVCKEEECDGYMCYGEYAAGFLFSTCPATQYHTEKMWIPMLPGYSSSATLRKPGCNSDGRTVAHHGSSTVPTYSIGGYVMSPSGLTQFDPYVVSVSLSSLASPRSGTETSFILELSFRNFIARTLSATKESYSSYYGSVFSPSIVDIEIDITSGLGAIVTDLSYIAVGHTLIPFSAPFTEANEATIYSIALRQKRSNTEYVFRVNLGYHIFNHNAANPITLRFLATAVSTLTAYAATTLSVSARPGAYYTYNGYQEWHFYGCGNYAGNTRIYTPAQLELTVEGFLRTGTSGSNHILTIGPS